jgi:competence protein ComEA
MMVVRPLLLAAMLLGLSALPAAAQPVPSHPTAPAPSAVTPRPTAPAAHQAAGGLLDINSASPAELDALPGIGKARTEAIIKNRPYKGKDDLVSRHIIPKNVYDGIKDRIIARQS